MITCHDHDQHPLPSQDVGWVPGDGEEKEARPSLNLRAQGEGGLV